MSLFLKESIEKLGHTVLSVFSEASSLINYLNVDSSVDLVLMDILIKGEKDGIQAATYLQKRYSTPVMFITSYKDSDTIACAQMASPIGYLIKPISQNELEAALMVAQASITNQSENNLNILKISNYQYDTTTNLISEDGVIIKLSNKESLCLSRLIQNIDNYVSKESLSTLIWNDDCDNEKSLRELLYRIRRKLPKLNIINNQMLGYTLIS